MTDTERLSKRVASLLGCSRREAEQIVEGGFVSVDGVVVDQAQHRVGGETVAIDPAARAEAIQPLTLLWHKPAGLDLSVDPLFASRLTAQTRWSEDASAQRVPPRRFKHLLQGLPLEPDASGLVVLSEDERVQRRLAEAGHLIEQEFVVETSGTLAPNGLARLMHGMRYRGWPLPPAKVSWQNEFRLRFALKGVQPGQLREMCSQVGLQVLALRRLRVGSVSLGKMPVGQWRVQPPATRF